MTYYCGDFPMDILSIIPQWRCTDLEMIRAGFRRCLQQSVLAGNRTGLQPCGGNEPCAWSYRHWPLCTSDTYWRFLELNVWLHYTPLERHCDPILGWRSTCLIFDWHWHFFSLFSSLSLSNASLMPKVEQKKPRTG